MTAKRNSNRVVLYALNKRTRVKLHLVLVDNRKIKFSSKGVPHYYRGAPEAALAAWALVEQFPQQLRDYELYWR